MVGMSRWRWRRDGDGKLMVACGRGWESIRLWSRDFRNESGEISRVWKELLIFGGMEGKSDGGEEHKPFLKERGILRPRSSFFVFFFPLLCGWVFC